MTAHVQHIHLCESFDGEDGTNDHPLDASLSGEQVSCDCTFHNQKNGGGASFSVYNFHILLQWAVGNRNDWNISR